MTMRKTTRWLAVAAIGALGALGCAGQEKGSSSAGKAVNDSAMQSAAPPGDARAKVGGEASGAGSGVGAGAVVEPAGPKIIRTAEIQLEVPKDALKTAFDRVAGIATAKGGFVADSSLNTAEGSGRTGRLVLRVPGGQLDAVLAEVGPVGKVLSTQLKGEDVTGQLVDLDARITTLQAEENALRILVGKANTVGEVLQVQSSLFDVRQQIEQLKAQQASLSGAVSFATLTVGLREPLPGAKRPPEDQPNALERAWRLAKSNTAAVLTGIVLTIGATVPVWVPALVIGAVAWAVIRRRRSARDDLGPAPEELAAG